MTRPLALCIALSLTSALAAQAPAPPADPPPGDSQPAEPALLERFLTRQAEPLVRYRATRRLEAENKRFNVKGWMEVTTELSPEQGFTWTVIEEGGSGYIRNKVLRKTLEGEAQAVRNGDPAKAALSEENYTFTLTAPPKSHAAKAQAQAKAQAKEEKPAEAEGDAAGTADNNDDPLLAIDDENGNGHARLFITPKRKDMLLVDGALLLAAADADLVRIEGRLAKTPSFWTRSVDIVRRYARVAGIRVPVATESTANVRIAGRSAFKMTYTYQMINGKEIAGDTGQ